MTIIDQLSTMPAADLRKLWRAARKSMGMLTWDNSRDCGPDKPAMSKKDIIDWLYAHVDDKTLETLIDAQLAGAAVTAAPKPEPAPQAATGAMSALETAIKEIAGQSLDMDTVERMIDQRMSGMAPRTIDVRAIDGAGSVTIERRTHPMFEKVLRLAKAGAHVLLVGAAGTGKSTLARDVAEAMGLSYSDISMTEGASETELLGQLLPTGANMRFEYHSSAFVDAYEQGGLFLFEEMDAGNPNMLLVVNTAMANGGFTNPMRYDQRKVTRHNDCVIMATANTFGTGADMQYVGRSQLDAATLDRWYVVNVDYDTALEAELCGVSCGKQDLPVFVDRTPEEARADAAWLHGLVTEWRKKARKAGLQRVISTRMIQRGLQAIAAGILRDDIKSDLLAGWSQDERAAIGAQ